MQVLGEIVNLVKLPVKELVLPKDLKRAENGRLPAVLLVDISGGGKLHHIAARAWEAMHAAAIRTEGIKPFKPTSNADAYRSFPQQLAGFMSRYVGEPNGSETTRHYLGKKYWLKKVWLLWLLLLPVIMVGVWLLMCGALTENG